MKITDIRGPQTLPQQGTGGEAKAGGAFQRLLEARLAATGSVGAAGAPSSSFEVTADAVPAELRLQGLELSEGALDLLDRFQAALADGRFAARDLEPFASALEDQTAALLAVRDRLPADHPLSAVVDQVAAVAYVEAAKFRRGDYS